MIRVFVASEITLYREGLAEVLAARDGIEVAGTFADPAKATETLVGGPGAPIMLLDMGTPEGVIAGRRLARVPGARVLAITVPNRERAVIECAEAGVTGFLTTDASLDDLVAAIEAVARGEPLCPPSTAGMLLRRVGVLARRHPRPDPAVVLTSREREIVFLVERGLSNKQIAQKLCIELPTVKNHVHHILEKLGVRRRAEAASLVRSGGVSRTRAEY